MSSAEQQEKVYKEMGWVSSLNSKGKNLEADGVIPRAESLKWEDKDESKEVMEKPWEIWKEEIDDA